MDIWDYVDIKTIDEIISKLNPADDFIPPEELQILLHPCTWIRTVSAVKPRCYSIFCNSKRTNVAISTISYADDRNSSRVVVISSNRYNNSYCITWLCEKWLFEEIFGVRYIFFRVFAFPYFNVASFDQKR